MSPRALGASGQLARPIVRAALLLVALACPGAVSAQSVTFTRDVAPVLWQRCGECHRPNGAGPFSLITYADARRRAQQIADVTRRRYMPPWKPEPGENEFVGSRRMTDREIELLSRWVEAGAPEGDRAALPSRPQWTDGWRLGRPDLVLTLPEYVVPATGASDVFRNFVIDVPLETARFVRGFEMLPSNAAVHHANIYVDPTAESRARDTADPAPGFEGLIPPSASFPDGTFLGWTPGQAMPLPSDDLAWRLPGRSTLLVQLHLRATGKPERIQPAIGLYFAQGEPRARPLMLRLGRQDIDIAPEVADYRSADEYLLPADIEVHAVLPHAHYRSRSVRAWATLPTGERRSLITIADWDFNWQDGYRYQTPIALPKGTRIQLEYRLDNSAANPRNPARPLQRAIWGFRSGDEMADVWLQITAAQPEDRDALMGDVLRKMTADTIVGYETQIRANPDYVAIRNDVAVLYMDSQRPDRALPHFERVVQLQPASAAAHFNLGTALQATGREASAVAEYQEAIRLDTHYARARDRLASIFYNRAYVLDRQQRASDAIAELRRALEVRPDWPAAMGQLAWMLATGPADPGAAQEAVRMGQRAAELTQRQDLNVLDSLAAAYAAAGHMDQAVSTATAAEAIARLKDPAMLEQIRARLALYRQGQRVYR
jgi:tetratricopeptide (TPR) repeat protein/mono/diheme cytochrome c family protein